MHRPHAGMTSLKTMFGLAPRKKTRRLPTWSDVLRNIGQITFQNKNVMPRRMQDRSKYGPHNGRREKARRLAGGFHALRQAAKYASA